MASNPIRIRWIRTCSQPNWKIMYRIVLQLILARILSTLRMLQATFKALSRQTNQPKKSGNKTYYFIINPVQLLHGGILVPPLGVLRLQPLILLHLPAEERGQDGQGSWSHTWTKITNCYNHASALGDVCPRLNT